MLTPIAPPNYWPLRSTSSTSVTVTAGDGTIVCTNTNNATVAIPSAANLPNQIIVVKKGANNTATVTLDPDGSETIDGATSYVLYVVNDYVVIQSDGSNWQVVGGYLAPHRVSMYRDTAISVPNSATFMAVPMTKVDFDVGGLADTAVNGGIVVRRTGQYRPNGRFRLVESTVIDVAQCQIRVNGNIAVPSPLYAVAQTSGLYTVRVPSPSEPLSLTAGDIVTLYVQQINSANNTYDTLTTVQDRPMLALEEIR